MNIPEKEKIIYHIDMSVTKNLQEEIDRTWDKYVCYNIFNVPEQDYEALYIGLAEQIGIVQQRISVNGGGKMANARDLKYDPNIYHFFASNTRQPLHTDCAYYQESYSSDWLMLYCMDVSEFGGMTHILSVKTLKYVLEKYNPELLEKIKIDINWKYMGPKGEIIHTRPLFDGDQINWNYWQIKEELNSPEVMSVRQDFFDFMEDFVQAGRIFDFSKKWNRGDCIIFNDHLALHGRDAFLGNNMWLRYSALKNKDNKQTDSREL